ncbi:MAG TPA: hypothetical protein VHI78_07985 [Bacteroidales bacterium]|jgi:hypothetical protein|nr:hypothetical protein [Bacteroidales bacterium]
MKQNFTILETSYTPVAPVYFDVIESEKEKDYSKIFYFSAGSDLDEASGKITGIEKNEANEEYLCFDSGDMARLDRIVTINGKPGPAYDEYDRYALACLDCNGGMD